MTRICRRSSDDEEEESVRIDTITAKGECKNRNNKTYHVLDLQFTLPGNESKSVFPMAFINDASLFYKRCEICAEEINNLSFLLVFETHHYILLDCCGVWDLCQNLEIDTKKWS
mgnify:CR=1 FL=1